MIYIYIYVYIYIYIYSLLYLLRVTLFDRKYTGHITEKLRLHNPTMCFMISLSSASITF